MQGASHRGLAHAVCGVPDQVVALQFLRDPLADRGGVAGIAGPAFHLLQPAGHGLKDLPAFPVAPLYFKAADMGVLPAKLTGLHLPEAGVLVCQAVHDGGCLLGGPVERAGLYGIAEKFHGSRLASPFSVKKDRHGHPVIEVRIEGGPGPSKDLQAAGIFFRPAARSAAGRAQDTGRCGSVVLIRDIREGLHRADQPVPGLLPGGQQVHGLSACLRGLRKAFRLAGGPHVPLVEYLPAAVPGCPESKPGDCQGRRQNKA